MRALLPCSPATNRRQGAGAGMAGLGSEERFGVCVGGVSKCSAVSTGPGVCPRAAPLGFHLKPSLSHSRGRGSEVQQDGLWSDSQDWRREASGGSFSGRPALRQRLEKLTCRSLLQQPGLEVIGSEARPPLPCVLASGSTGLSWQQVSLI